MKYDRGSIINTLAKLADCPSNVGLNDIEDCIHAENKCVDCWAKALEPILAPSDEEETK